MRKQIVRKSFLSVLLIMALLCAGCASSGASASSPGKGESGAGYQRFNRTDLSTFDTVITLIGFAPDQEAFDRVADEAFSRLNVYDHIFDGYNEYEGLHNLYYVNRHAAQEPVEIPADLFQLIAWCKAQWAAGLRQTNIAMGAVLSLWHDYRSEGLLHPEQAQLPPMDALTSASAHTDFDNIQLDEEKQTVFFSDPAMALDIGAVAKGYAADRIAEYLYEAMPSFLLSLGGNVYAGAPPLDGRAAWAVGVQDPKVGTESGGSGTLDILDVHDQTVVTSGDYWRYYTVDGQRYHHIIDPETLMPSRKMLSVTIVCESSTLADFLSTAFFVLSYEEGRALAERLEGVEVMWVLPDGQIHATEGMLPYSRKL